MVISIIEEALAACLESVGASTTLSLARVPFRSSESGDNSLFPTPRLFRGAMRGRSYEIIDDEWSMVGYRASLPRLYGF
jgi:hypothetical protein